MMIGVREYVMEAGLLPSLKQIECLEDSTEARRAEG
jgi:hypothetical protein